MSFYYHIVKIDVILSNVVLAAEILRKQNRLIQQDLDDVEFIDEVASNVKYRVEKLDDGSARVLAPCDFIKVEDGPDWLVEIANTIKDGSFVEIVDDDNCYYRVVFFDGKYASVDPLWPNKEDVLRQIKEREEREEREKERKAARG